MKKILQFDYEQEEYGVDAQNTQSVVVEIASLPVEIRLAEGNSIKVLFPKSKQTDVISSVAHDKTYKFHHEIQKYSFPFSGLQHFHEKVFVELPHEFHGDFSIKVSNGTILVNSPPELNGTQFITANAAVTLNCLKCRSTFVQSKNGAITVKDIESSSISLKTCNASITGTIKGDIRDYAVESHTTIGKNTLPNITPQEQPNVLKINNRNGQIDVKFVR